MIQNLGIIGPNGQPMTVQVLTGGSHNGFGTVANNPALTGIYDYSKINGQKPQALT